MYNINNSSDPVDGNYSILRKLNEEVWERLFPVAIYLSMLLILGITGNSLVIFIWSKKMKRSSTNVCVLLLACFDLLTSAVGTPLEIYDLSIQYTSDNAALCKVSRFLINFSVYGSMTALAFIAILRFVKVCHPLKLFPVKSRGIIVISIGMGLGWSWPALILHGLEIRQTIIPGVQGQGCGIDEHLRGSLYEDIYYSSMIFIFLSTSILMTVLYVSIAWYIFRRNQRRIAGAFGQTRKPDKKLKINKTNEEINCNSVSAHQSAQCYSVSKNSLMFFAITLAFVLSFLPVMAILVIVAKRPHVESTLSPRLHTAYMFCLRSYFINNCINPILYGFWNRQFREESIKLITNCRSGCRTERDDNSTSNNQSLEVQSPGMTVTTAL